MSYKEKGLWLTLAITFFITYTYFEGLFVLQSNRQLDESAFLQLLLTTAIWLTVLTIIGQIIIAIIDHKNADEITDERDQLIDLRACKVAYYILSICIVGALVQAQLAISFSRPITFDSLSNAHGVMHLIISGFLVSEMAKYGTQLYYYRRGF